MKLNKIYFERDLTKGYESFSYKSEKNIDSPFIAGKLKSLIPEEMMYSQDGLVREESNVPLFNEIYWTERIVDIGKNGVYYLNLRPGYWLSEILYEPDDIVVDIFISLEESLIYSFYNPTERKNIVLRAKLSLDKEGVYQKIKNNPDDIIWRQYFIKRAERKIDLSSPPPSKLFAENMTAEEAAEYLNIEVKTLRNWTSSKKVPFTKIGGTVRYRKSDIDEFLKQHTIIPNSKAKKKK